MNKVIKIACSEVLIEIGSRICSPEVDPFRYIVLNYYVVILPKAPHSGFLATAYFINPFSSRDNRASKTRL